MPPDLKYHGAPSEIVLTNQQHLDGDEGFDEFDLSFLLPHSLLQGGQSTHPEDSQEERYSLQEIEDEIEYGSIDFALHSVCSATEYHHLKRGHLIERIWMELVPLLNSRPNLRE